MDPLLQDNLTRPEPWTMVQIVLNTSLAFLLGLYVAFVYRSTNRQMTTSFSFINTLVLLAMMMTLVMMVIGNNIARAFGLVGAMSIIRFRTVVKDTRDTAFVFYSLATGMAAGTGNLKIGVVGTVLVGLFIFVLHWLRHGAVGGGEFMVAFSVLPNDGSEPTPPYEPILKRYCRDYQLVQVRSERAGESVKMTYHVTLRDAEQADHLVGELSAVEGLFRVLIYLGEEVSG